MFGWHKTWAVGLGVPAMFLVCVGRRLLGAAVQQERHEERAQLLDGLRGAFALYVLEWAEDERPECRPPYGTAKCPSE
jgi:hypothetical protein